MWLDLGIAVGSDHLNELRPRQPSHVETREALMDIVRGSSHASDVTQHCLVRRHSPKLPIARISMCPSMGWRSRRSSARTDYPCVRVDGRGRSRRPFRAQWSTSPSPPVRSFSRARSSSSSCSCSVGGTRATIGKGERGDAARFWSPRHHFRERIGNRVYALVPDTVRPVRALPPRRSRQVSMTLRRAALRAR